ncbi:DNA-binding protein [Paenibacillus hunanensis]|uniref:DNA-binding protein n=1 Tax=Paenibacillus hunanensis TaxID=539262 RepID=UPI002A6B42C3|nr:DNA-binding protein [Paenibacillus hunanensis]WPP41858.1 DNA-binding protein [Paenibacillus hunanensis]
MKFMHDHKEVIHLQKYFTTLRHELEAEIARQGYSLSSFSKASGINRGILSSTLNGSPPKPMSINQLDKMVQTLNKPEGWLYEKFAQECFNESGKTNWRRVRPLLLRCIELDRNDLISRTLGLLMEDPNHISHVFELAEELSAAGQDSSAIVLYRCVIENERNYHSERLAVSQYRIFSNSLSHNIENNLKAAIAFEPFRNQLPVPLKLEALLKLGNVFYTVQDWEATYQYGTELYTFAKQIYDYRQSSIKKGYTPRSLLLEHPLVYYYGQGLTIQFSSFEYTERYDEAKPLLNQLENLDWFEDDHPQNQMQIERFRFFTSLNRFSIELLSGNIEVLADYSALLRAHPEEALTGLHTILEAANKHHWNVDFVLADHEGLLYPAEIVGDLDTDLTHTAIFQGFRDESIIISRYVSMYYELAIYYCNHKVYDNRLENILIALETTIVKYNRGRILDCLQLFKKLRELSEPMKLHKVKKDNQNSTE